jgi:hypothetical protein
MIFKNIFGKKFGEKMEFLTPNKAKLCKILIIALFCLRKTPFLVENCGNL